jgi:uroporphyrinogen-III synthase
MRTRPLEDVQVLVTRPKAQAAGLAAAIADLGGIPLLFPTLEIEPVEPAALPGGAPDLVIFTSINAVAHGRACVRHGPRTRFAAVGRATAAALRAAGLPEPLVPPVEASSEGLLADPRLELPAGARVCLVRGVGGRDLLPAALRDRGLEVEILEVYRRRSPDYSAEQVSGLEARWTSRGIDVMTATSVETLANLHALLSTAGRELFAATPLVVVSDRIAAAARELGHRAACSIADSPADEDVARAVLVWHRTRS